MKTHLLVLVCLTLVGLAARPAAADFATPWVEGTKVGDVVTAHAWVVTMDAEQTAYGVVVMTDTMQHVLIPAEAEKGVVDPAALGRWAMVKAVVTVRIDAKTVKIKILEVTPIKPAPPKPKP
jgi:vacuolar-type H+-ATPase catalytic subunit A/Vma1